VKYFKRNILVRKQLARQTIVASYFYSFSEGKLHTDHYNMLRSILWDVLDQNETFFFHFQHCYRQALRYDSCFQWPYNSLKDILLSLKQHPTEERLYFILDAMDESEENDRRHIINLLYQLCDTRLNAPCSVKIFLASRPIAGLRRSIAKSKFIKLQDENESDILRSARTIMGAQLGFPPGVVCHAMDYITKHAQGVFVWVNFVAKKLLEYAQCGCSKQEILDSLKCLPIELDELYGRLLSQLEHMNHRDIRDSQMMFQLVLFACRQLTLAEFRHALAIPDDILAEFSPLDKSFENELIYGIDRRIIHCGGNFLEVKEVSGNFYLRSMLLELFG
jgi:hypothetical protein